MQNVTLGVVNDVASSIQQIPGSAILLRYIKSSYQNDPVRSAVELFLFLFAVRYLLSPKYSTQKKKQVTLTEDVGVYASTPSRVRTLTVGSGDRRAG